MTELVQQFMLIFSPRNSFEGVLPAALDETIRKIPHIKMASLSAAVMFIFETK